MSEKLNILIAVPAYRSQVDAACAMSLMTAAADLAKAGVDFTPLSMDREDIAQVRNLYATLAMARGFSHLLFIDSDVSFPADAVRALIDKNKSVVGYVVPRRIAEHIHNPNITGSINLADSDHGMIKIDGIGMALTLIAVDVFHQLSTKDAVRRQDTNDLDPSLGPVFGFFDRGYSPTRILSEDLAFCQRWRQLCGGEVYALTDKQIGHAGRQVFKAVGKDIIRAASTKTVA